MFSCGGKRCGVGTDVGNGVTEGKSVGRGVTEGDGVGLRVGSSVGNGDEGKGDGGNVGAARVASGQTVGGDARACGLVAH